MRKISFKLKITLWYTMVMTILVVIFVLYLLSTTKSFTVSNMQTRLQAAVSEVVGEIEIEDGALEFEDNFHAYERGIYLSVYGEDQTKYFGALPAELPDVPELSDDDMRNIKENKINWYIYDLYLPLNEIEGIWVRGIASQEELSEAYHNAIILLIGILPLFILSVGILGYFFTKRALRPVRTISEAAKKISEGNDLSIRIPKVGNVEKANMDELQQMASIFNHMLERIEIAFQNEKQFTQDASHELRTPTTVIISQAECALSQAETLEEAKESLEVILSQGKKMACLVTQLLNLSRLETGQTTLELEKINLSEMVEMVIEELREEAEKKNILITVNAAPDIIIHADETLIMRLWINLISNAISYGKENGHIDVSLKQENDRVYGSVRDDGIGIGEEHLNRIWERFYRVDSSRNAESGSMGLGLSMVKWIVEMHKGKIVVKSKLGVGTEFQFILPK